MVARPKKDIKKSVVKKEKFKYKIVPIDVDGDGIPDGDLIEKIDKSGAVVSRKFVTNKKMTKLAKEVKKVQKENPTEKTKKVVVSKKRIDDPSYNQNIQDQQVIRVADATTFGQTLKTGAANGIGLTAGSMLVNGIADFFSD